MLQAYDSGSCVGITGDHSSLVGLRLSLADTRAHIILNQKMSREPLGPLVRHGDDNWLDVISWVVQCTFNAELLHINQKNVSKFHDTSHLGIQKLLGHTGDLGQALGLNNTFCLEVIKQVGNYADIYNRNFGTGSALDLPRGLNTLYGDGGIIYPLPFK